MVLVDLGSVVFISDNEEFYNQTVPISNNLVSYHYSK
jgi:hypothetical protein